MTSGQLATTMFTCDGLAVFFQSGRTGLDAQLGARLAEFIGAAQHRLDVAVYDLREEDVLTR
jgi:hypothetical protein